MCAPLCFFLSFLSRRSVPRFSSRLTPLPCPRFSFSAQRLVSPLFDSFISFHGQAPPQTSIRSFLLDLMRGSDLNPALRLELLAFVPLSPVSSSCFGHLSHSPLAFFAFPKIISREGFSLLCFLSLLLTPVVLCEASSLSLSCVWYFPAHVPPTTGFLFR